MHTIISITRKLCPKHMTFVIYMVLAIRSIEKKRKVILSAYIFMRNYQLYRISKGRDNVMVKDILLLYTFVRFSLI